LFRPGLGEGHGENAVLHGGFNFLRLRSRGQWNRPRELAISPLANRVSVLISLCGCAGLARDHEAVVVYVDINVLFLEPGELERHRDAIVLGGLMYVHARPERTGNFVASATMSAVPMTATTVVVWSTTVTLGRRILQETMAVGQRIEIEASERHVEKV